MNKLLLTPDEVAMLLNLAKQTLARWRHEGKINLADGGLPYVRFNNRRVFYRPEDVHAFIEFNMYGTVN